VTFTLASSSPRRLALLAQIGLTPSRVIATDIDETPHPDELPRRLAERLAREKALAVQASDDVVLAADTVVACGRRILPKAETEAEVRSCLALLDGRAHVVITGVCVAANGVARVRSVLTRVKFKRLSSDEVENYVASGEWRGKAGGYGIQGRAERFVVSMTGSYSNIVGLPLFETAGLLRAAGVIAP
jgi:septum formation protein